MAIPELQSLLLPVLQIVSTSELVGPDIRSRLAAQFSLSADELSEKRGPQSVFANRIAWAIVYLQRAGLIEKTVQRRYRATPDGFGVLAENPPQIDLTFLQRFPSYAEWRRGNTSGGSTKADTAEIINLPVDSSTTPEEQISKSYQTLTAALEIEVLDRIREMSPGVL